jgi:hypothetical protein
MVITAGVWQGNSGTVCIRFFTVNFLPPSLGENGRAGTLRYADGRTKGHESWKREGVIDREQYCKLGQAAICAGFGIAELDIRFPS